MRVYFRVDANHQIGLGHLVRCLAIAAEVSRLGGAVCFLTCSTVVEEVASSQGFQSISLGGDPHDLSAESASMIAVLSAGSRGDQFVLIDTYAISPEYVSLVSRLARVGYLGSKFVVAPELDLLINYSGVLDLSFYQSNYGRGTDLLLGLEYAPLRREFSREPPSPRHQVEKILVLTGGADRSNMLGLIIKQLVTSLGERDPKRIIAVAGPMNENVARLRRLYHGWDRITIMHDVANMAGLMDECDIAISAGGTSTHELVARRLPFVVFALVPEQAADSRSIAGRGLALYGGDVSVEGPLKVAAECARLGLELTSDAALRAALRGRMAAKTSEPGASRIARMLVSAERMEADG